MRPKAKRPTVPVQSLGLESRPGLDVPRRAVPERRVFESGNKAERSAPIGSNVDGAHPRGPRDPTPAGRGAPQKDPSPIVSFCITVRRDRPVSAPVRERASLNGLKNGERHEPRHAP